MSSSPLPSSSASCQVRRPERRVRRGARQRAGGAPPAGTCARLAAGAPPVHTPTHLKYPLHLHLRAGKGLAREQRPTAGLRARAGRLQRKRRLTSASRFISYSIVPRLESAWHSLGCLCAAQPPGKSPPQSSQDVQSGEWPQTPLRMPSGAAAGNIIAIQSVQRPRGASLGAQVRAVLRWANQGRKSRVIWPSRRTDQLQRLFAAPVASSARQ